MKTLVIERKRWLRGEGSDVSRLYRPDDRKMCCLGFYLRSCDISIDEIRDESAPHSCAASVSQVAPWLLNRDQTDDSVDCGTLMRHNDRAADDIPDYVRETKIAAVFARHGVKVVFK